MTTVGIDRRSVLALVGAGAVGTVLGGCTSSAKAPSSTQTIRWWHIAASDPLKSTLAKLAERFEADNPNVKFKITPLESEAFKTKITTSIQAGDPPDIFHTWGGGALEQQVDAGMVKAVAVNKGDLVPTAIDPYTIGGKTYALPNETGMVGFWYNKELFAKAGVDSEPATWAEFLGTVRRLKSAGVTPIALGGKEKWPGHYYWAYLAMRVAGIDALRQAAKDKDFNRPGFVTAGQRLKELVDLQPFQKGFLAAAYAAPDGQSAIMGNGQAAMELMGAWAPAAQKGTSQGQTGLGDKLGFFPFPAVDGGSGKITDVLGGGGGFALGRNAPSAAAQFLKFIAQPDNARERIKVSAALPAVAAAGDAVADPNMIMVSKQLARATGFQLYLDQAFAPAVGQQVNDSVTELLAGSASPEQVARAITGAAKQG